MDHLVWSLQYSLFILFLVCIFALVCLWLKLSLFWLIVIAIIGEFKTPRDIYKIIKQKD